MSDYIKREYKLPNGGTVTADFDDVGIAKVTIQAMDALFDILNSSDVVEVVRCKDCKWWKPFNDKMGHCGINMRGKDQYCDRGTRADK